MRRAFTLVELLIVVAIIAILAGIAVPNLLEAQTRAKAARAKADLRTIATAIETYQIDYNKYPSMLVRGFPGGVPPLVGADLKWWYTPDMLSTPVAYLTTADLQCPFGGNFDKEPYFAGRIWRRYGYENLEDLNGKSATFPILLPRYGNLQRNRAMIGTWRIQSVGPDRLWNPSVLYDPTNGTVSGGDIIRTQLSPEGNLKPHL